MSIWTNDKLQSLRHCHGLRRLEGSGELLHTLLTPDTHPHLQQIRWSTGCPRGSSSALCAVIRSFANRLDVDASIGYPHQALGKDFSGLRFTKLTVPTHLMAPDSSQHDFGYLTGHHITALDVNVISGPLPDLSVFTGIPSLHFKIHDLGGRRNLAPCVDATVLAHGQRATFTFLRGVPDVLELHGNCKIIEPDTIIATNT